jgi:signal transduction histidine kinase
MEEIYRVLVVDDDEVDRMAVRRALKTAGVQTDLTEATTSAEAIATLQDNAFDCVFLDYRLPDKDGLALVQEIHQTGIKVPLVVLTGQGDEQIAVNLMKAGVSDYLSKSRISPEALARILRNSIRVFRAEKQAELANQRLQERNELLEQQNQELERQRQQIQHQNLRLLEVSRLKSQFLATMSHELRTPLNAIIGFSQMLLRPNKGTLTTQQRDMVERILKNGKNLLTLLTDILDFSKVEAGRLDLKPEPFDLSELVHSTVEELRCLAEQKRLNLQVSMHLLDPLVVNDPNRLRQILINLLSNAIEFTETGSVEVEVKGDQERLAIAVRDTGVGIASEDLEQIFEPFRQLDQSSTRKHPGTGLGLAITDSLVRMMQGQISVESQVGEGSIFQVQFPRKLPLAKPSIKLTH